MGIHDGHRKRMKNRFLKYGLDNFDDHAVLELLLYYALPRGDVNPIAHELINRFGSLDAVLDAPMSDLIQIPGVGENAAALIKIIPQVCRRYLESRVSLDRIIDSSEKAGEFVKPYFYGKREETVFVVGLDAKCKVIAHKLLGEGDVTATLISIRKVVEFALTYNAAYIVLAHNHPSGVALPSSDDVLSTKKVQEALLNVGVKLFDHVIVADDDFVSLRDCGYIG